jgi:hypothetical protein
MNMPNMDDKINVKEFLDSITTEDNTPITGNKDGDYFGVTYKQMMQEILKDKTELTFEELLKLTRTPKRLQDVVKHHTYYSKSKDQSD